MRKVLIAIAVLIVLLWLIPWEAQRDGEIEVPPPVVPVVAPPDSGSTPATDNTPVIPDEAAASDPVEPRVLLPDQVALTPMEQKAQSARALIDPGMAGIEQAFAAERVDALWAPTFRDLVRGFGLDVWRMQGSANQNGATTTVAYLARPGDCYHGRDRSVCYPAQ